MSITFAKIFEQIFCESAMSNQKSENRIRNNKIRRQKEICKNILATTMTIGIIIILSLSASSFMSKAKSKRK